MFWSQFQRQLQVLKQFKDKNVQFILSCVLSYSVTDLKIKPGSQVFCLVQWEVAIICTHS